MQPPRSSVIIIAKIMFFRNCRSLGGAFNKKNHEARVVTSSSQFFHKKIAGKKSKKRGEDGTPSKYSYFFSNIKSTG